MDLGLSGLASGFDWRTFISQMIEVERAPEQRMRAEQSAIGDRSNAYGSIKTQLSVLQNRITALSDPDLFDSRLADSSDASVGTVSASPGAPLGSYEFNFQQLATAAKMRGSANVGKRLSATDDVTGLVLSSAGFNRSVTAGTITVNGKQVAIATSDTLDAVFGKISAATGGSVTGRYSAATDQIILESAGEIVLGSGTDTSNFLQVAKLQNNGSGSVVSGSALGALQLGQSLSSANLATAVNAGGSGTGEFKVNGVSITFKTSDSLQQVLDRINDSSADVTATYDSTNDRFVLTNKSTGDTGVGLQDVTGNFLAATGLNAGTLERGKNLLYTINGGDVLSSQSNTITEASSGINGLSVTALQEDSVAVSVSKDTGKIKTAIQDFITEYNKVQSLIDTQTASSTDASGKVTAGILASEGDAYEIGSKLRSLAYSPAAGLATDLANLGQLGIVTNGNDNNLQLEDEKKLDAALADKLGAVKELFTNATSGVAVKMKEFVEKTSGEAGTLTARQDSLAKESSEIDTQISDLERVIASDQQRLTDSFVAMETAQAQITQQLKYLQQRFGTS